MLERYPRPGGLARVLEIGGERLEAFYHHLFTTDTAYVALAKELGIEDLIEWLPSRMGVWTEGRLWDFATPQSLLRFRPMGWSDKIRFVLAEMATVLGGLTRGLDWEILDRGFGTQDGRTVSYRRESGILGAVLPSNSPGVHSLWLPAVALKIGLALKPGRQEPWTPYRVCQALMAAGLPPEALGFYPTDYNGAAEILLDPAGESLGLITGSLSHSLVGEEDIAVVS